MEDRGPDKLPWIATKTGRQQAMRNTGMANSRNKPAGGGLGRGQGEEQRIYVVDGGDLERTEA